ncbi:MAG: Putative type IIS restriction /modification enzyme, N-terminal half [uncultured Sulfurovum sp.]|uniref:site-specific DNA-methyltransferase (adenine-specific) n=1 Tax=uncultured Sulfurovum sp. TaxID=269237 RepID=A0A6S6S820_9BACT|nr:MAG: Putative type IIS restriction /modification enzyme, N-terminal half [uncultured Sulfurovum sp.]
MFSYCDVGEKYKKDDNLLEFISKKGFEYTQSDLNLDNFSFLSPQELKIKKQIENIGTPLKDWDIKISYGIKTGFNEAFIIDTKTKDELIAKDKKSEEIIKPLLNGRDVKKYKYKWNNNWLIFLRAENNIEDYPAIKEHMNKYKNKLEKRSSFKKWYSIQGELKKETYQNLENDKIILMELSDAQTFTLDTNNFYINKTLYFISGQNLKYLLAFLNSKIIFFSYSTTENHSFLRKARLSKPIRI